MQGAIPDGMRGWSELWSAAGRRFWRPAGCARFALLQIFDALRIQIFDGLRRIDGNDSGDLNATLCDAFEDIQQVGGSDAFYSHGLGYDR